MSSITYHFKVDNPNLNNEVIQMRSDHLQPIFRLGGDHYDYYMGIHKPEPTKFRSSKIKVANLRK